MTSRVQPDCDADDLRCRRNIPPQCLSAHMHRAYYTSRHLQWHSCGQSPEMLLLRLTLSPATRPATTPPALHSHRDYQEHQYQRRSERVSLDTSALPISSSLQLWWHNRYRNRGLDAMVWTSARWATLPTTAFKVYTNRDARNSESREIRY